MNPQDKIRIKTTIAEQDQHSLNLVSGKISSTISTDQIAEEYIDKILNLLHEAFLINQKKFIEDVFFEFYTNLKKVSTHKKRIYDELSRISDFSEGSINEKTHLVNIYRNIISDLFDPYISIIVACLQYKEGTFLDFIYSNLGQGERNKYDYSYARLKPTNLFDGYNPLIRNAISHTGTDSILYEANEIVFRKIKRGNPPCVTFLKWSANELQEKIMSLLDFIHAIDVSIEIFGIDIGDIIKTDENLSQKFISDIINIEQRLEIQDEFNQIVNKIKTSEKLNEKEKVNTLTNILFLECGKRNIPILSAKFNLSDKIMLIQIPEKAINFTEQNDEILSRILEMLRYGIIAEPCFRGIIDNFIIQEESNTEEKIITIQCDSNLFKDYGEENIGLVDILPKIKTKLKGKNIKIDVDFNKIQEQEYKELSKLYPRKKR